MKQTGKKSSPPAADSRQGEKSFAPISKTKIRLRLMIAIPVMTTLLVLGLGLVVVDLNQRELLSRQPPATVKQFRDRVDTAMEHTTIAIVAGGGIALLTGLILAIAITWPIKRLTAGTASIASGDLTRNIHVSGDGEIALLGSAFNNMISSINRYLLQTMAGGVVTIDERGNITSMSTDSEVILGVNAQDFIGRPISDMIPRFKENAVFHETIASTLKDRRTFVGKEMMITTEDRDRIPISISTSFLKDRDNTLIGLIISFDDVAHLRKIQDQMRIVDRLTTLGGLAAGIAHQVRNPLCSIRGLAQLLKESDKGAGGPLSDYSNVILSDVDRIDKVVERLLKFIQPTTSGWSFEPPAKIIEDTVMLAKHEVRDKEIDIRIKVQKDLPDVLCQEENLMQALLNLLVNAIQSIEKKGVVEVAAAHSPGKKSGAGRGGEIVIKVSDNGPGIKKEHLSRIFNPSFTTKEDGAGFGLVITRQTVEAHGGRIIVESEPGKGAAFTIWLPVREEVKDLAGEGNRDERIESV